MSRHPAPWSEAIIDVLREHLVPGRWHDPFAGTGMRLGRLADEVGAVFTGTEIEGDFIIDPRVIEADATRLSSYPTGVWWTVVTSPTYANRMADYPEGPLATTNLKGRRSYGIALGRPLHENNTGRCGPRDLDRYFALHRQAISNWGVAAVVNVSDSIQTGARLPVVEGWAALLREGGYRIHDLIWVETPRYRNGANADVRVDNEAILVAVRYGEPLSRWWRP